MSDSVNNAWHAVTHNVLAFIGFISKTAVGEELGSKIWGLVPAYIINAFVSYRDYKFEENRLRNFYEPEVAAVLGKRPEAVTIEDLKAVGQMNPVLGESLRRNKNNRNMEFIVSSLCITAAVFVTTAALAILIPTGGPLAFLLGMAIGLPTFLGLEHVLEPIGKHVLHLAEPKLKEVSIDPRLQPQLSLSSQIHFIERLQSRKHMIHTAQVRVLLAKADPIRAASLSPAALQRLTDDLNTRQVRAQELAFLAFGQASGVQRLESPRVSMLEKANAEVQHKLAATQQRLSEFGDHAKARTAEICQDAVCKAQEKLGFRKTDTTSAVVPERQFTLRETTRAADRERNMAAAPAPA